MRTPQKKSKRVKKGITLVEVMVSMFIFALMMMTVADVFSVIINRRTAVKKMQQQSEEFSLATSFVAKRIRMSTLAGVCDGASCTIHDNSAPVGANTTIVFDAATNELKEGAAIIASNVTGGFTAYNTGAKEIPLVTIHMMGVDQSGAKQPETSVQTSVSLRSY
jgi:prepilin-type N-terminal cleavage/methylation domain-containing protein